MYIYIYLEVSHMVRGIRSRIWVRVFDGHGGQTPRYTSEVTGVTGGVGLEQYEFVGQESVGRGSS